MAASAIASFPFINTLAMSSPLNFPAKTAGYFSTVSTKSGHILAQFAQPLHSDISVISTGLYPLALIVVLDSTTIFLGHAVTHSPQPLHAS